MSDQHKTREEALATLRGYVDTMVRDERDLNSLGGPVLHYGMFLRQILTRNRPEFLNHRNMMTPTRLNSGEALTPWHASMCMEDRTRTAAFIRGSVKAVEHTLSVCAERPLHLVEAGCGPLGTLALPLLARFSKEELVISLIDLHQESIDCMTAMLDHFGFLPRTRQLICGDATTVSLKTPVHLVLTETMNSALTREPQVAITRALLKKNPGATLIPQSIRIDVAMVDTAAEISHFPPKAGKRTIVAPVFELNRRTAIELPETNGMLPAATVTLPEHLPPQFTPCFTTTIFVFDGVETADYDTQISHPVPLHQQGQAIPSGATIRFSYMMGDEPGLIGHITNEQNRGTESRHKNSASTRG